MFLISERILLTIWIGGMWVVGYVVAPVLFKMLERSVAGDVAGQLFTIMSYIGLVCGVLLLTGLVTEYMQTVYRQWRFWLLLGMLLIIVIGQFILQPMMAELKSAGLVDANAQLFARLHGVASILFLLNSLAGLILVISGTRLPQQ